VTIQIQPVVAALLGWWILGETLTPVQALGGALVLGAIVLAQRSQNKTGAGETPTPASKP
jgi:drug/metabolite transporter (DMT)-like permease